MPTGTRQPVHANWHASTGTCQLAHVSQRTSNLYQATIIRKVTALCCDTMLGQEWVRRSRVFLRCFCGAQNAWGKSGLHRAGCQL